MDDSGNRPASSAPSPSRPHQRRGKRNPGSCERSRTAHARGRGPRAAEKPTFLLPTVRGPNILHAPSFGSALRFQDHTEAHESDQRLKSSVGPQPSSEMRTMPSAPFGSATRVDAAKMGPQISTPVGPGTYESWIALGKQIDSRRRTAEVPPFGAYTAPRMPPVSGSDSPGPTLSSPPAYRKGRGFSFGSSGRSLPMNGKVSSPGPVYSVPSSFGRGPQFPFAKPKLSDVVQQMERNQRRRERERRAKGQTKPAPKASPVKRSSNKRR